MERLTQLFDAYTNAQLADCLTGMARAPTAWSLPLCLCRSFGYGREFSPAPTT